MLRFLLTAPFALLVAAAVATLFAAGNPQVSGGVVFALMAACAGVLTIGLLALIASRRTIAMTGFALAIAATAFVLVWRSDRISFESAGSGIDQALADARGRLLAATGSDAEAVPASEPVEPRQVPEGALSP